MLESLLHESAYLGVMRMIDVTDDTINIQKSLLDELKSLKAIEKYTASGVLITGQEPPWIRIAKHKNAHKLLLRLLTPAVRYGIYNNRLKYMFI